MVLIIEKQKGTPNEVSRKQVKIGSALTQNCRRAY